jgi:hypothetical protein
VISVMDVAKMGSPQFMADAATGPWPERASDRLPTRAMSSRE